MVTMAKVDVQSSVEHHKSHEEANEIYTALRVISIEKMNLTLEIKFLFSSCYRRFSKKFKGFLMVLHIYRSEFMYSLCPCLTT